MEDITLQQLLEAGCHFGHKSERWNPRAAEFIYTEKDGVHIIDLVKTKAGLEKAAEFVRDTVAGGAEMLFVGTKRQAKGILKEEAERVGAPYFSVRWIGGFLTNWDEIRKNIKKINKLTEEQASGAWKKFPKHEQMKLARYLNRLKIYYGGVLQVTEVPQILFIVDVRKESSAVREAKRTGVSVVGIVDTNSDPLPIDLAIPANDDAVGSVQMITRYIASAYAEGKKLHEADAAAARKEQEKQKAAMEKEKAKAAKAETEKTKKAEPAKQSTDTLPVKVPATAAKPEQKKTLSAGTGPKSRAAQMKPVKQKLTAKGSSDETPKADAPVTASAAADDTAKQDEAAETKPAGKRGRPKKTAAKEA